MSVYSFAGTNLKWLTIGAVPECPAGTLQTVVDVLTNHRALETIQLDFSCGQMSDTTALQAFIAALRSNTALTEFTILSDIEIGASVTQSLVDMLQQNFTLQGVHAGLKSLDLRIQFLLALNSLGRKRLLTGEESVARSEWVRMIMDNSDFPSLVFYYLSLNPSLLPKPSLVKVERSKKRQRVK